MKPHTVDLTAMVLAAGFGKRLHPLTLAKPKPLLPLKGRPCIDYIISALKGAGVNNIIINTHYLSEQINAHFQNDPDIQCIYEPHILETGGAVAHAQHLLADIFIVANSDIWFDNSSIVQAMISMFDPLKMDALLLMIPRDCALYTAHQGDYIQAPAQQYGSQLSLSQPFGLQYINHAAYSGSDQAYIYGGIQIWKKSSFLAYCPQSDHFPMVAIFHQAEARQRLYGMVYQGLWCDIGTLDAYEHVQKHM